MCSLTFWKLDKEQNLIEFYTFFHKSYKIGNLAVLYTLSRADV